MCRIHIHTLSTHSVLLDILKVINTHYTPYVHILHYVHIYTHSNIRRWNRLYIRTTIFLVFVQCVRVVQLNCVKVKVQFMSYRKVGVCCRVYYFWLFISLIAWGKKLSLSRLVRDRMLWRRLPEGSRESSLWDGWLESLMIYPCDILEGGKLTSNNVAGSSHDPLQSFAVASCAVSKPGGDAAGQDALHSAGVE